jgi:hypothetical protein
MFGSFLLLLTQRLAILCYFLYLHSTFTVTVLYPINLKKKNTVKICFYGFMVSSKYQCKRIIIYEELLGKMFLFDVHLLSVNNHRFMLLLLHFESPLVSLLQVDKKEEEKKERKKERKRLKCVCSMQDDGKRER